MKEEALDMPHGDDGEEVSAPSSSGHDTATAQAETSTSTPEGPACPAATPAQSGHAATGEEGEDATTITTMTTNDCTNAEPAAKEEAEDETSHAPPPPPSSETDAPSAGTAVAASQAEEKGQRLSVEELELKHHQRAMQEHNEKGQSSATTVQTVISPNRSSVPETAPKSQRAIQEHHEKEERGHMAPSQHPVSVSSSNNSSPLLEEIINQVQAFPEPRPSAAAAASTPGAYAVVRPRYGAPTRARSEQPTSSWNSSHDNNHDEEANHPGENNDHSTNGESLVTAELVSDPVHAIQVIHVEQYDDNNNDNNAAADYDLDHQSLAPPRATGGEGGDASFGNDAQGQASHKKQRVGCMALMLLILVVVVAVAVPLSLVPKTNSDQDHQNTTTITTTGNITFPYECFHETHELNMAIAKNREQTVFVVCPNTFVPVGEIDTSAAVVRFVNGQPPIVITRENVEVRCGLDGSLHNNCTLSSGLVHVLAQQDMAANDFGLVSTPNHNLIIRGLTFTGTVGGNILWGGGSLILSNPGKNVQVIDCLWENITAPTGLVFLGRNMFQIILDLDMEDHSLDVSIINSTFRNVVYDGPLMLVFNQTLSLHGCQFENVRLAPFLRPCLLVETTLCNGLMYCYYNSVCHMEDICVHNLEYHGIAALLSASHETQWTLSGTSSIEQLEFRSGPSSVTANDTCASGVGQFDDYTYATTTCIEEEDDQYWKDEATATCNRLE